MPPWSWACCNHSVGPPSLGSSQAKTVEEKRNWTHHIKRLILENHHATIPQKVRSQGAAPWWAAGRMCSLVLNQVSRVG